MFFKKNKIHFLFYFIFLGLLSCTSIKNSKSSAVAVNNNQEVFWQQLKQLCGKAFEGEVVEAPASDTAFRGKKLIIHIRSCEENRIRIPFIVGTNRSRTFIIRKFPNYLEWKHDHRHEDGTPDEVTMYGGSTNNSGSNTMQIFPADQQTAQILPAAIGNVWWVQVDPGKSFTYNLRRLGTDRLFSIRFDLTKTVELPQAPWGWKD